MPNPEYIMAVRSYEETAKIIEDKINEIKDKKTRELYKKELEEIRKHPEYTKGLKETFERKIEKKNGKFIAFCSNTERLQSLRAEIENNGLLSGVNKKINIYQITFRDKKEDVERIIKEFERDKSDSLKIILSVDMFNEGIHIKDIDGCFLFRPTISPEIYTQQIGRVLSFRNDKDFRPQIFDVVNNLQSYEKMLLAFEAERSGSKTDREHNIGDFDNKILPFEITGCDQNFFAKMMELSDKVSACVISKEMWLDCAKRYVAEHGNLEVPERYIEEGTELKLGVWIKNFQKRYENNPNLNDDVRKALIQLDPKVFEYNRENFVSERDENTLKLMREFVKDFGIVPVPSNQNRTLPEKYLPLSKQCAMIKQFQKGKGTAKFSKELISSILSINPKALDTRQKINADRDEQTLDLLKQFVKEFGQVHVPGLNSNLNEKYVPLATQCSLIKQFLKGKGTAKFSPDFIEQLLQINPNALKEREDILADRDEQTLDLLSQFVNEFGQIPVPSVQSRKLPAKYKHIATQCQNIKRFLKGDSNSTVKYESKFIERVLEINPNALKTSEEIIAERDEQTVNQMEQFVAEYGQIPVPGRHSHTIEGFEHLKLQCCMIKEYLKGRGSYSYSQELISRLSQINPQAFNSTKSKQKE